MNFRRAWNGDEWQIFALQLVQLRHKPQNVQIVPDKVRGDAGIEFFTTDGCLYQCYAPEEVSDVAKAASAMKAKCGRDLPKLVSKKEIVEKLLQQLKMSRWILLCPFLDNKDVVIAAREKGLEIAQNNLPFLASDFEALVQSQADFVGELEHLRRLSLGPTLQIQLPSAQQVQTAAQGEISSRLTDKLGRAFPGAPSQAIENRKNGYVRAHLIRENALDSMRIDQPILWERSVRCLEAEERRLVAAGAASTLPGEQLTESITRIEQSLEKDLPDLPRSVVVDIALGTVSDWLFRCPLDFV